MAGKALGDIHLRFVWQALDLWHWAGSGGALGLGLVAADAAALCVARVALGDIHLRFTWQAWHLQISTFVSRGRRGTYGTGLALAARLDPPSLTQHLSHTTLSHTIFDTPLCHTPSFAHPLSHTIFVTYHLSHTIFHTQLCHTPSVTPHLSKTTLSPTIFNSPSFTPLCHTHHISHTTLSVTHHLSHHLCQTSFHTPLCHTPSFTTPSFTHNFVTHHLSPHHLSHTTLSHTIFHTQLVTLSHALFHTQLSHTPLSHTPSFFVTHDLSHMTLSHTKLGFTSRSSTTSFVFPSFPVPATTFGAGYWKKLRCGVKLSLICVILLLKELCLAEACSI